MVKYLIALMMAFGGCSEAYAESHAYINTMRSGESTHVFVQQSLAGEYGKYKYANEEKSFWKGYGVTTGLGLEIMKFVQFQVNHTLVNLKSEQRSLQGSRLTGGGRLSFLSPMGNLELGAGFQGSRLDHQLGFQDDSVYGSGVYWSLGVNYFLANRVSVYYEATQTREHFVSPTLEDFDADSILMGLGFRIWL